MNADNIAKLVIVAVIIGQVYLAGAIVYSAGYKQGYSDGFRHAGEMTIKH